LHDSPAQSGGILLLSHLVAPAYAGNEINRIVRKHSVWIRTGLSWERDPGEPTQKFASATVLYFGEDGKFGFFGGVALRRGSQLALSEGEGGTVYSGNWTANSEGIHVDYRLVDSYKVIQLEGQKPPEIPGSMKHATILLTQSSDGKTGKFQQLQFEDTKYEAAPAFKVSQLRSMLEIFDRAGPANKNPDPALH